jgi:preprotein translocase subunit SecD
MKGKNGTKIFFVIFITAILAFIAFRGLNIEALRIRIKPIGEVIRYGIDIRGGVRVVLEPVEGENPTDADIETIVGVLGTRLDSKLITDRSIIPQKSQGRVIVEIPLATGKTDFDPQREIEELGSTQMLEFYEIAERVIDQEALDGMGFEDTEGMEALLGQSFTEKVGEPIVTGADVRYARHRLDEQTGRYLVALEFYPEGQRKFEEATGRLIGKRIGIYLDEDEISSPTVQGRIVGGDAVITLGQGDRQSSYTEAKRIADAINSGALPFSLQPIEINSISPVLGVNALQVTVNAGMVAILLVWIFMILYYRLPGIFASIALLLHVVIQLLFIGWTGITLTLPGIAGIILTIGMGVDANIIIFERVKEELKSGKTLRAAVDIGFKKAIGAIFDANVTTLIAGVILYIMGTGPVKSFAITLMLGVFLSFLTAITASRILLKSVSVSKVAKKSWLFGA